MSRLLFCLAAVSVLAVLCTAKEPELLEEPNREVCKEPKLFKGCSMEAGECVCGKREGCENSYPYRSHKECENDKKGLNDKCRRHPCVHGECVQNKKEDGRRHWQCQCAGSGYHGRRCQRPCPPMKDPLPPNYPSACVY